MFFGWLKKNWVKIWFWIIFLALFILPFYWYPKGAMDLGGDGTRLYFYDPLNFLRNTAWYSIASEGKVIVEGAKHAYLIYVSLILFVKTMVRDSGTVVNVFNGIKLSMSFVAMYFLMREFIVDEKQKRNREIIAVLAGLFYVFFTATSGLIFFWDRSLHSHDQIFLNPLLIFFLLRYFLTHKKIYFFLVLSISFIFSTNFSLISAPPFFAFYPIALFFLLLYVTIVRKKKINLKELFFGIFLFLGLQSFHLLPSLMDLFHHGRNTNAVVFTNDGSLKLFDALRGYGLVSANILFIPPTTFFNWISIISPLVVIIGFLMNKNRNVGLYLTSIFFFITLFLVSANITNIGYSLYRSFFHIPGFSMFRHFFIQWAYIFIFFYALLFGQLLVVIFLRMKEKYVKVFSITIIFIFTISFWQFLNGNLVNAIQWGSRNVRTAIVMDPRYEATLSYIRTLPTDGKMLLIPITDNFNQVVFGLNNGAYLGPTSISYLTRMHSFEGYQSFDNPPYTLSNAILSFAQAKNYRALTQIFSLLSIKYIYHDNDPNIFEKKFPNFPNSYMMAYLPKTQREYTLFLQNFPIHSIYENGPYHIYQFNDEVYRPEVYIPDSIIFENMIKESSNSALSFRSAFIDKTVCLQNIIKSFCTNEYISSDVHMIVKKINPVSYTIAIQQTKNNRPFLLVFQNSYDSEWKLSFANKAISEDQHVIVNTYANGWVVRPTDHGYKTNYSLSLSLETQKYFWYGLIISGCSLVLLLIYFLFSYVRKI